ncbi:Malonyl-[acyl-carrier protein] O-methyltransferase [Lentibacillus sp. JNUCC-1]|uniref:class I SAM-dependent methyltransferase n=1 Tax=Lentibacillus sp. JNUCC-1 TaxID=2654513 RepID=UPI0012E7A174|nr:class I SAM-dependent methyltransferase [Lentibacillus sp. JNUCC-1]MUV38456.1 Malonyl-[acyl-carrier protein] O-methyltransferase [Lentibacillus sp. JNUCC-1]
MTANFNWRHQTEKSWNQMAPSWHERSKQMWDHGSRKDIIPFIKKHSQSDEKMLDIGAGDGYGSYKLHQSGYKVTGMDLSSEMVRLATQSHEDIAFQQGDVNDLPFEPETFDAIMCINVLEWTEQPLHALNEIARVLKSEGRLFAGILGPTAAPRRHSYPRLEGQSVICNTMMPWEFQQLATEHGFMYENGMGVFKKDVDQKMQNALPLDLQQALTFMWVFSLRKRGNKYE